MSGNLSAEDVERDVVTVRSRIDYERTTTYVAAVEALDRLAILAHEGRRLKEANSQEPPA